ncbi:MAG: YbjN domain-containing protein [Kaiparowitsia implicata GSE-PSE-MK54-09C]|jgi:hypothetical protein|nr:YbjN domain-containing protein [Kaiparowitsia implicata GSE-PSE-MK54-09C]
MALTFQTPTQEITYHKVSDYLSNSALFKDLLHVSLRDPQFDITYGSAQVAVEVLPWDVHPWEERELAIVKACSCVTVGSDPTPEMMHYLLTENHRMRFGAFHLSNDSDIRFAHTVLGGESMDLMELQTCILSVVTIADTYDDIIRDQFGGQRAVDRIGS